MDAFYAGVAVGFGVLLFAKFRREESGKETSYLHGLTSGGAIGAGGAGGAGGNDVPVVQACTDGCACAGVDAAKAYKAATNPLRPSSWTIDGAYPAQIPVVGVDTVAR